MQTAPQNAARDAHRPTPGSPLGWRVRAGWLSLMILTAALIPVTAASVANDRLMEPHVAVVDETPGCVTGVETAHGTTAMRTIR